MSYDSLQNLSFVLKGVLNRADMEWRVKEHICMQVWDEVVGKQLSDAAQPEYVRDGVLFVITKSPVWSNELTFYKQDMISKLNKRVGAKTIRDIVFKVGRLSAKKKSLSSELDKKPSLEGITLSDDEIKTIESIASNTNEEAVEPLKKLMFTAAKLEKWKKSRGWTPCRNCGSLQNATTGLCPICENDSQTGRR